MRDDTKARSGGSPTISSEPWGASPDGRPVTLFTLRNTHGMTVQLSDWGGIVTRVRVPDRDGAPTDVVLGFDSLAAYLGDDSYAGALIGRYANRIAGAAFELDGNAYRLAANDGPNHLHGGVRGFDRQLWESFTTVSGPVPGSPFDVPGAGRASVVLSRVSEAGEEGFPGRLETTVTISLTNGKGIIGEQLQQDLDRLTYADIPVDIVFEQGAGVLGL
jgi:aldose 1-epimerase